MGNCYGLFSSYYLITDLLEINRCIGIYSTQRYNKENYDHLKNLIIKNGCVTIKFVQWYISNLRRKNDKNVKDFCKYFEDIFDQCPYHELKDTETIFKDNFGFPIYDLVQKDTLEAIASGSIGQVYKAKLKESNSWIAIKIKHPNIDKDVQRYTNLFKTINWLREYEYFNKRYYLQYDLDEFLEDISGQLDFNIETKNARKFKELYKDNPMVCVPKIFNNTNEIIISEFIDDDDFYNLSAFNRYKCAMNLTCFMQETAIIHNFIHADFHCKNWQVKKLDDNNYQIVIYDCALVSSAENIEASHLIWEVFESCDINDFEKNSNLLLYVLKTYLIKEGDINSEFEEEIKTLYKNYLHNNLDFSFLGNEIMEITLRRKFVANKSLSNIFLAISMILEFLCDANLTNCDSTHLNSKALVNKRNLFELLNFCQVTNSYHLLQDSFKKRIDKLKNKDNTFDNLFADLQRNELKFGSIDDIDDSDDSDESGANDDNDDNDDNDVSDDSDESGANDSKTINKIKCKSV
jgi:predicted unusual protein kinase regulating ubiquinone biosynthesis (AarF/ABC1/UbiB family)